MSIKRICRIGIFAALTAVCSWVTIPAPVPFTMQTFAVFAAGMTLGGFDGFLATAVWIALGAAGLPVFSGFSGGISKLFGVTGGYILGFLFVPLIMLPFEKRGNPARTLSFAGGMLCCYAFGTAWFAYVSGGGVWSALISCVFPFVLPDAAKIAAAALVSARVKKAIKK